MNNPIHCDSVSIPGWVPILLKFAGIYNLAWGAFVVLFPSVPFGWLGLQPPNYPSVVQCLGMVIGVYGIGYWIAASDPAAHWPIVLVGLLGKIFGPIGFFYAASVGELPWKMGFTILTNDIAWWWPFTAILIHAARVHESRLISAEGLTVEDALRTAVTSDGDNLYDRSFQSPLLIVCVRHLGCTFCREMLAELAKCRSEIERTGTVPVVVSMGTGQQASSLLNRYGLNDVSHVSDPDRRLYHALALPFGTLGQLFGWNTLWRALIDGTVFRFGFGRIVGNALQLSGAFIVKDGQIKRAIRHRSSAERTNFREMACEAPS